jgi:hypothetical protein
MCQSSRRLAQLVLAGGLKHAKRRRSQMISAG